ncbi:hypothetical protein E3P86_02188 [Wallemia ichthyophaga]|uniref:F-box domain-containing protein n=1 Tax=Wallemia ichthyophaga TaxID=245174 RepID=A0A4T0J4P6_WALIC|nr:hypothetical protein E3P86_02188 [Wallemia ichthyophaga]
MLNLPFELVDEIFSQLSFKDRQSLTLVKELSSASSCRVLQTVTVTDFDKEGITILNSPRVVNHIRNLTVNCEYSLKLPKQFAKMKQLQTLQLDLRFISQQMELFSRGGSRKPFGDLSLTTFLPASNTVTELTLRLHSTSDIEHNRIVLDELILRYPSLETLAVVFDRMSSADIEPVVSKLTSLPLSVVVVKCQTGNCFDRLDVLCADRSNGLKRVADRKERVRIASSLYHFEQIANKFGY